jgi:hypothetical protein
VAIDLRARYARVFCVRTIRFAEIKANARRASAPVYDENVIHHRSGKNLQTAAAAWSQRGARCEEPACGLELPDTALSAYPAASNFGL